MSVPVRHEARGTEQANKRSQPEHRPRLWQANGLFVVSGRQGKRLQKRAHAGAGAESVKRAEEKCGETSGGGLGGGFYRDDATAKARAKPPSAIISQLAFTCTLLVR